MTWVSDILRKKNQTRSIREMPHRSQQRHTYLHEIQKQRQEGYTIVYLDESFIHHYHGHHSSWFRTADIFERPAGKGRRWCFIHAISSRGFLPNSFWIFEAKKTTDDYHGSFNFEVFYKWFLEQLMNNLPNKSCIVMDRATYHRVPSAPLSPAQMRKAEIQSWLTKHKIPWESYWLKPILIQLMAKHLDRTPKVSKAASKHKHNVLGLKVHHPELNPIELAWGVVKNDCAKHFQKTRD